MSDKTWKKAERKIAEYWPGARRRGADFRGENAGKSDLIMPGYSIEVKHSSRPTFGLMKTAVEQAELNQEKPDDIPVAVIHKKGEKYDDSLVIMTLKKFQEFFINQNCSDK
jgi:hypothetical protein